MSDSVDKLFKGNSNNNVVSQETNGLKTLSEIKSKTNDICANLCVSTKTYNPKISVEDIKMLVEMAKPIGRIQYSEISACIFGLDGKKLSIFLTNLDKLLIYALEKSSVDDDVKDFVLRLNDHAQLVIHQVENSQKILTKGLKKTLDETKSELKNVQKEYTTILGIFSSVVLTFVGSLIFTSSVLANIHHASVYRLVFVISIIAIVVVDAIMMLIKFLYDINGKSFEIKKQFNTFNIIGAVFCVVIAVLWLFDLVGFKEYISTVLPW